MYTIEYMAHNRRDEAPQTARVEEPEGVLQLVCALNYTGFTFRVMACGIDLTESFTRQMQLAEDTCTLPVCPTAGGIPAPYRIERGQAFRDDADIMLLLVMRWKDKRESVRTKHRLSAHP